MHTTVYDLWSKHFNEKNYDSLVETNYAFLCRESLLGATIMHTKRHKQGCHRQRPYTREARDRKRASLLESAPGDHAT